MEKELVASKSEIEQQAAEIKDLIDEKKQLLLKKTADEEEKLHLQQELQQLNQQLRSAAPAF